MKRITTIFSLSLLLILPGIIASGQMNGTYTVDPASTGGFASKEFTSIKAAVDSLISLGVDGAVTVNIADGEYTEQINLSQAISGSSASNTITFQSASGDSSAVIVKFSASSGSNFVWRIKDADYLTFSKLSFLALGSSYGRLIDLDGNVTNLTIENCRFLGYNTTSNYDDHALIFSYDDQTDNIVIQNNMFQNGAFGVRIEGINTSTLSTNTQVLNNVFQGQREYGVHLYYQNSPHVNGNTITPAADPATGIYFDYCDNQFEIMNNKITMPGGRWGIYLDYCDANTTQEGMIANNFITLQGDGSDACGIRMNNANYQFVYHNSVYITSSATGDYGALYLSGGGNNDIRGNIFANFGGYQAVYINTTSAVSMLDYNCYYATGNYLAHWNGEIATLAGLQSADGMDANSISVNPNYPSETNLRTTTEWIDGNGTDLGVSTDIDGNTRTDYDMGAYEIASSASQTLSGTYTIGGSSPDFATFNDAVDSLNAVGVSGPVTFMVRSGTYNEQITIYPVSGASASNTVTFESESGDSTDVTLSYNSASANNWVVRLQGADYINFKGMTISALNDDYSIAYRLNGSASNDSLMNCYLTAVISGTADNPVIYSYQATISNIVVMNNRIDGGQIGVYLDLYNISPATGTVVIGNTISEQNSSSDPAGIYLRNHEAPLVSDNDISNPLDNYYYGIYLRDCTGSLKVLRNTITSDNQYGGIQLYNCTGTSGMKGLVANNFVEIGGTSTAYGIYIYSSDYQNIYNNSIRITSTNTSNGIALYTYSSNTNINVWNNIFANFGGGRALYINSTSDLTTSDYNDLYTTGNFVAYWDGSNRTDLAAFQTASSKDANSISANPSFVSAGDLHTSSSFLDGAGSVLAEVTTDIDGEARDGSNPDIGADEFSTATVPLSGTYTIGGSSPDYATFSDAADDLTSLGVSGPVTFNVRDGSYNEQFVLLDINGTSPTNTVTFQSESGDSTAVELSFNASATYKYIIQLVGTDNVVFKNMTFSALNTSYSLIFDLRGGIEDLTISNCVFNGKGGNSYEYDRSVIYSGGAILTDVTISDNVFTSGRSAVWLACSSSYYGSGLKIMNNTMSGNYYEAIYLHYFDAPMVSGNTIDRTDDQYYFPIFLYECSNKLVVSKNRIRNSGVYGGIKLANCVGTTSNKGLVANNFCDVGGTYYAYGIYTETCSYLQVFSNSVRITSTDPTNGRAYYNYNGNNIEVKNNIFANLGGGYAYYANNTTSVTPSDYNDLFTTGSNLAYWSRNHSDLASVQAEAEGIEANSISANPGFVSASDLHTTSSYLDSVGTVLAQVTDDVDGEARDATYPDIGADEFVPTAFPLSGTYTIGGSSPDYATFSEAVDDLNNLGVDGPVTFNVRSGTYEEQISLLDINGADAANTITFQSESGDSSTVELTYDADEFDKYVVELVGTDFITFKNMTISATNTTYSLVFYFRGGLDNVTISNCALVGPTSSGYEYNNSVLYSNGAIFDSLTIENNLITGGRSGIWLYSASGNLSTHTRILNNTTMGQYYDAVYLRYHDAPVVEHNDITMSSGYSEWGIYLHYCDNALQVRYNEVKTDNYYGGIYLNYCNGTTAKRGLVSNNFVDCGGTSDGNGIQTEYSNYQRIYSNTVRITTTSTSYGRGFTNYYGSNIEVKNNIFANMGGGYAYYVNNSTSVTASDYNDLFTTGNYVAYWNGGNRASLADLQALPGDGGSGMDANSISVNPSFAGTDDIHTTSYYLDSTGVVLAQVTDDIDGEPRDATYPDIGADEFTATELPLAGTYTIGGSSPDYATFSDAVDDLNNLGVLGPVTFNVRNGDYNEHFEMFSIPGVSASDTVVFQSESGDSSKVNLYYNASSSAEDYLVKLTGPDYITFRQLTLAMTNSSYSTVLRLNGSVNHLNLMNNILSSDNDATGAYVVYSASGNITDNILIASNLILGGGYGIYLNGNSSVPSQDVVISGNRLEGQYYNGIYLAYADAPKVQGNWVNSTDAYYYGFYGINLRYCDNDLLVAGNRVTVNGETDGGIYLYYCSGTYIKQGAVVNNFVGVTGSSYSAGIYLTNSEYQHILYNSVNIASTYTGGKYAFYLSNGSSTDLLNNNFACTKGGYAYYVSSTSAIVSSDYNNFYTSSGNLAYWNGDITDLTALKSASTFEANSVSADPKFLSPTSYIPGQVALHQAASPITEVTTDILGHARDASTPDIGAYEFYCSTPNFNIEVKPFCIGDSTIFVDKTTGIAPGSTISWDFDGDFNPEKTSTKTLQTVKYLYSEAGDYTLNYIVQHFAGCNDFVSVDVTVNPELDLDIATTGAYCDNDDGTATVTVNSGQGPFTYSWSNGANTATATGLAIGKYTVAVTDGNECVTSAEAEIEDDMQLTVTQLQAAHCGNADGIAEANIEGGEAPYIYQWSNQVGGPRDSTLVPGPASVTVKDNNGCFITEEFNISNDGSGPQIALVQKTDIQCYGDEDGAIDLDITGGSTPYDIQWSNGAKTDDISNLTAGVYNIRVLDQDSCATAASYEVVQPTRLSISTVIENASCNESDGRAVAVVSGGTEPYFYNWSTGGDQQIEDSLFADIYSVRVTDFHGCEESKAVIINNVGAPTVSLNSLTGVTCADTTNGAIDINVSGGTPLYSYEWSNGETTQDLSGLFPGDYKVTVKDAADCIASLSAEIVQDPPAINPICLVTVDSLTNKNLVAWERNGADDVDHFNVYRESSQKGVYQLIGQVPNADETTFLDSVADPAIRSWKYRISVVDVCGNESQLSTAHKTMHLTMNIGLSDNSVNLIWDHYQGFDFSTYHVWRFSTGGGWENLDNLASTLTSYTDFNAPDTGTLYYVVEIDAPNGGCTPTELKAGTLNTSRSNKQTTNRQKGSGISVLDAGMYNFIVYPNPSTGLFHLGLDLQRPQDVDIRVFDLSGKMVYANRYRGETGHIETDIDLSRFASGIYQLRLTTDNGLLNRILVKQ